MSSQPRKPGVYAGQQVALLTQHGKERVILPTLEPALGCQIQLVTGYDTDLLGTFTRDIPRQDTQLATARQKARIGMALSGLPLGLASEGSFGSDPMIGMLPWNIELLIWIDDERALEVVGRAQGKANASHLLTADWSAAESFARLSGFPEHHLVVRPEGEMDARIRKGIHDWQTLEKSFFWALKQSAGSRVLLEIDVRAHANPTRMETIRLAAEDLAQKLCSLCPACVTPGFWVVERLTGLPCADCGAATKETRAEIYGCLHCTYREIRERAAHRYADPGRCDDCNP